MFPWEMDIRQSRTVLRQPLVRLSWPRVQLSTVKPLQVNMTRLKRATMQRPTKIGLSE